MKEERINTPSSTGIIVNTAYMVVLSLELMLRDIERRLDSMGARMQREKKQKYSRFLDVTKKALYWAGALSQDIYDEDAENKWKNIPAWQEESNELARLILLYEDKSATKENIDKVFSLLRELPGEGMVTEKTLEYYYLKK